MATITTPDFWMLGSVGSLGPSCEIKLAGKPTVQAVYRSSPQLMLRPSRTGICVFKYSATRRNLAERPECVQGILQATRARRRGVYGGWLVQDGRYRAGKPSSITSDAL